MTTPIDPSESISRFIIYDTLFEGNVHTDNVLFPVAGEKPDGYYHWSGVLRKIIPIDQDVHNIGCDTAANQNVAKNDPPPGPKRRYYCGFRSATAGDIGIKEDDCVVELINDHNHHVDIRLKVNLTAKAAKANARTNALMAIAEVFSDPVPHICECDSEDGEHPLTKYGPACLSRIQEIPLPAA